MADQTNELPPLPQRELDALLDHIYEYGTIAEGIRERALKLCEAYARAALASQTEAWHAAIELANRRQERIRELEDALASRQAPEGWKWVPVETTPEMRNAGAMRVAMNQQYVGTAESKADMIWRDMIAALPSSPSTGEEPDGWSSDRPNSDGRWLWREGGKEHHEVELVLCGGGFEVAEAGDVEEGAPQFYWQRTPTDQRNMPGLWKRAAVPPSPSADARALPPAIAAIAERLHTQDNRITAHPLFAVQQKRRIYGLDADCRDGTVFIDDEGIEFAECDPVDKMEASDPWLREARNALAYGVRAVDEAQLPHAHGHAVCEDCGHRWIAVWPLAADALECPKCHSTNTDREAK